MMTTLLLFLNTVCQTKDYSLKKALYSLFFTSNSLRGCFEAIILPPIQSQLQSARPVKIQLPNIAIQIYKTKTMHTSRRLLKLMFSTHKFDHTKDYYRILNLSNTASDEQIKQSYKQLAKKYHPDVNKGKGQIFKQINEAYQLLSSKDTRIQYDQARKTPNQTNFQQQKTYNQGNERTRQAESYHHNFDTDSPQFKEHLRKQHEEVMKKYARQRKNYSNLGAGYDRYDEFAQQKIRKKAQKYQQKDTVTQQSVKYQEQLKQHAQKIRDEQDRLQWQHEMKKSMHQKYDKAKKNTNDIIDGFRRIGKFVNDIFRSK